MIPVDKEHKMTKEFVGLIDPNNAYSFVAGNVKAFYKISKKNNRQGCYTAHGRTSRCHFHSGAD